MSGDLFIPSNVPSGAHPGVLDAAGVGSFELRSLDDWIRIEASGPATQWSPLVGEHKISSFLSFVHNSDRDRARLALDTGLPEARMDERFRLRLPSGLVWARMLGGWSARGIARGLITPGDDGTWRALASELDQAIRNREVEPFFQPLVRLSDRRVIGFEALARWHKNNAVLGPDSFWNAASTFDLLADMTDVLLSQTISALSRLHQAGLPVSISLNVSAADLESPDFLARVLTAKGRANLPPGALRLEITEHQVIRRVDMAAQRLQVLKDAGIKIILDDFGMGYSSLDWLSRLPVSAIKIDRSFVGGMETNVQSLAVVRAIIAIAQTFNVEVVAEGVESENQAVTLSNLGCASAQGHLFAPALPLDAAVRFAQAGFVAR